MTKIICNKVRVAYSSKEKGLSRNALFFLSFASMCTLENHSLISACKHIYEDLDDLIFDCIVTLVELRTPTGSNTLLIPCLALEQIEK